jgi:hypothetical protein
MGIIGARVPFEAEIAIAPNGLTVGEKHQGLLTSAGDRCPVSEIESCQLVLKRRFPQRLDGQLDLEALERSSGVLVAVRPLLRAGSPTPSEYSPSTRRQIPRTTSSSVPVRDIIQDICTTVDAMLFEDVGTA